MIFAALSGRHRKAITELYRTHGAVVLRRARRITGSNDEAEEVLQEIFRKLVEKPESLDRANNELAWLYGATTNLCLNRIRNRKNRERLLQEKVMPANVQNASSAELSALVRQALSTLPDELCTVVVYYYVDQMSHAEIAKIVGCSRRQVGNLMERAHAKLGQLVGTNEG